MVNEWMAGSSLTPPPPISVWSYLSLLKREVWGWSQEMGTEKKRQGWLQGSWPSLSLGARSDPEKMRAVGSFHKQLCGLQFRAELRWQSRIRSWSEKQFSFLKGIQLCFEHCWRLKAATLRVERSGRGGLDREEWGIRSGSEKEREPRSPPHFRFEHL